MPEIKSKKFLTATAAIAATVGATAITTNTAHADAVAPQSVPEQAQTSQSQAQTQAQNRAQLLQQQEETRAAYNQAHEKATTAQNAANDAQTAFNSASQAVSDNRAQNQAAQNDLTAATSAQTSDQAALNSANQAVNTTAAAKSQAQAQNPGIDQSAIDAANSAVNASSNAVSQAQNKLSQDQQAQASAQQAAKQAQANLDHVNQQNAQAQTDVNNAKTTEANAQNALDHANDPAAMIKTAQDGVNSAQATADHKKDLLDYQNQVVAKANSDVNDAQKAVNDAQQKLNSLTNASTTGNYNVNKDYAITGPNKIVLNNDMINVLKDWLAGKISDQQLINDPRYYKTCQAFRSQYDNYARDGYNFISNDSDRSKNVSWDSAMNDANQYFLALLNPIRVQLGLAPLTTNSTVQNLAMDYGKTTDKDQEESSEWYSQNKVALDNGFTVSNFGDSSASATHFVNSYLNGTYHTTDESQMNRAGLKYPVSNIPAGYINIDNLHHYLFNYITGAIFPRDTRELNSGKMIVDFGSTDILKLMLNVNQPTADFGPAVNGHSNLSAGIYISNLGPTMYYVFTRNGSSTSSATPDQINQAKSALSQAQSRLVSAQSALNQAKSAQSQAQSAYNAAQAALTQAQDVLNKAKNGQADFATLQANLTKAKLALNDAVKKANDIHMQLNQAQSAVKDANSKLNAANRVVDTDQKALDAAKSALSNAQNKLKSLTAGHEALIQAIDNYNKALDSQKKAQAAVKADQKAIADAKQKADDLSAALPALQDKLNQAKKALDDANAKLAEARKAEAAARAAIVTDARIYGEDVRVNPVPNFPANGTVPRPVIANPTTVKEQSETVVNFAPVSNSKETSETVVLSDNSVPEGTTADWLDKSKVAADAHAMGTYSEDVLVTFPDGSTKTIKGVTMQVTKGVSYAHPTYVPAQLPAGAKIEGNVVVDENGQVMSEFEVVNGEVMKLADARENNAKYNHHGSATNVNGTNGVYSSNLSGSVMATDQAKNKQLPQTGNESGNSIIALSLSAAAIMFGLAGAIDKKRA